MKKILLASAIAATSVISSTAIAATDGTVGGTSTGTTVINVIVNDSVQISGLRDLGGTFDGVNAVVDSDTACVYRNGTGLYQVTGTGDGAGGAFTITNGSDTIPYAVNWNDVPTAGLAAGGANLTSGAPLSGQTGADTSETSCTTGGDTAAVEVTVAASDLLGVTNGTLTGTLSLLISPE